MLTLVAVLSTPLICLRFRAGCTGKAAEAHELNLAPYQLLELRFDNLRGPLTTDGWRLRRIRERFIWAGVHKHNSSYNTYCSSTFHLLGSNTRSELILPHDLHVLARMLQFGHQIRLESCDILAFAS